MDEKPSGGGSADAAALARDLVGRLSAISASLSSGLDRPEAATTTIATGAGLTPDFGSPRAVLENGARFVSPYLPGDATLRPLKALLLRILRIVTRDQTVFNSALLEALRGTLLELESAFRDTAAVLAQVRAQEAEVARAREALGHAFHETRLRVDGLEKDRDLLSDAAARQAESLTTLEKRIEEKYHEIRLLRLECERASDAEGERKRDPFLHYRSLHVSRAGADPQ